MTLTCCRDYAALSRSLNTLLVWRTLNTVLHQRQLMLVMYSCTLATLFITSSSLIHSLRVYSKFVLTNLFFTKWHISRTIVYFNNDSEERHAPRCFGQEFHALNIDTIIACVSTKKHEFPLYLMRINYETSSTTILDTLKHYGDDSCCYL